MYERLVEIYVKPELRDKIRVLKEGLTYDQFLTKLLEKNGKLVTQQTQRLQTRPGKRRMSKDE